MGVIISRRSRVSTQKSNVPIAFATGEAKKKKKRKLSIWASIAVTKEYRNVRLFQTKKGKHASSAAFESSRAVLRLVKFCQRD